MISRHEKRDAERRIIDNVPEGWDPESPPGIYGDVKKKVMDKVMDNKWGLAGKIDIYPAADTDYGKRHDIWIIIVWRLEDGTRAIHHANDPHVEKLNKSQASVLINHLVLIATDQLKGEMGGKLGRRFEARAVEIRPEKFAALEEAIEYLKAHQPPGHNPANPKGLIAVLIAELRKRTKEKVLLFTAIGDHVDYDYGIDVFISIGRTDIYVDLTISSGKDYFKADMLVREQDLVDSKMVKTLADKVMKICERKRKMTGNLK